MCVFGVFAGLCVRKPRENLPRPSARRKFGVPGRVIRKSTGAFLINLSGLGGDKWRGPPMHVQRPPIFFFVRGG